MHHADTNTTPDPHTPPTAPTPPPSPPPSPPLPRLASPDSPTPPSSETLVSLNVPDLRRRDARLCAEQITRRAAFLRRDDCVIVLAVYGQGRSLGEVAALFGLPVRLLRGRLRRILQRMARPEFAFVVRHMNSWPLPMRRVGECCILHGEPVRRAAQSLRLSLYTVTKYRALILALTEGSIGCGSPQSRSLAG